MNFQRTTKFFYIDVKTFVMPSVQNIRLSFVFVLIKFATVDPNVNNQAKDEVCLNFAKTKREMCSLDCISLAPKGITKAQYSYREIEVCLESTSVRKFHIEPDLRRFTSL